MLYVYACVYTYIIYTYLLLRLECLAVVFMYSSVVMYVFTSLRMH